MLITPVISIAILSGIMGHVISFSVDKELFAVYMSEIWLPLNSTARSLAKPAWSLTHGHLITSISNSGVQ